MDKLISNTNYGIELAEMVVDEKLSIEKAFLMRCKYDQFLSQTLTLGMFVPCDLDGNVLEHVLMPSYERLQYLEAKENVLFDGFEFTLTPDDRYSKFKISNGNITFYEAGLLLSNVESMIQKVDIYLSQTAKNQLS